MTSDRELDAQVAEKIMGFQVVGVNTCTYIEGGWDVATTWSPESPWATQEPVRVIDAHEVACEFCKTAPNGVYGKFQGYSDKCLRVVPFYSTNFSAAMEVVEKMREQGWSFACTLYEGKPPYASFCKRTVASSRNAEAESLPRAICEAALKAMTQAEQLL
jgi:hypothetical protein